MDRAPRRDLSEAFGPVRHGGDRTTPPHPLRSMPTAPSRPHRVDGAHMGQPRGAVVGHALDDGEARAACGAVGERMAVAPDERVADFVGARRRRRCPPGPARWSGARRPGGSPRPAPGRARRSSCLSRQRPRQHPAVAAVADRHHRAAHRQAVWPAQRVPSGEVPAVVGRHVVLARRRGQPSSRWRPVSHTQNEPSGCRHTPHTPNRLWTEGTMGAASAAASQPSPARGPPGSSKGVPAVAVPGAFAGMRRES